MWRIVYAPSDTGVEVVKWACHLAIPCFGFHIQTQATEDQNHLLEFDRLWPNSVDHNQLHRQMMTLVMEEPISISANTEVRGLMRQTQMHIRMNHPYHHRRSEFQSWLFLFHVPRSAGSGKGISWIMHTWSNWSTEVTGSQTYKNSSSLHCITMSR